MSTSPDDEMTTCNPDFDNLDQEAAPVAAAGQGPRPAEIRPLNVCVLTGETQEQASARAALTPAFQACISIQQLLRGTAFHVSDLTALSVQLEAQSQLLKNGDLGHAESILVSQAQTLDAMFHHLLLRASWNANEYPDAAEKFWRLAMKAQTQCRATLDSLANMIRPPGVLKQTNIAHGPQQVNNSIGMESKKSPNELLDDA